MRKLQRNTLVRVTGGVFPEHHGKVLRLVAPSETWADCWHTEPRLSFYGEEIAWLEAHIEPLFGCGVAAVSAAVAEVA